MNYCTQAHQALQDVSLKIYLLYEESIITKKFLYFISMPYAQEHYPFENKDEFEKSFPADFIAEGIDQTRGW